jgi:hypothetical protein
MNDIALRYRTEILRAVLGPRASELKADDLTRLNQIAEHLAQCEVAQAALRARGYGRAGMTFIEIVREVPTNALGRLKKLFEPKPSPQSHPDIGELHDIWTS